MPAPIFRNILKTGLLLITLMFSVTTEAQSHTNELVAVQQSLINMFEALSTRDSISLKAHCTADVSLYEYGQIWNIDTLIRKAITENQSADFKRSNRFEFINTRIDKKTAWITYRLESVISRDGKQVTLQWLETAVLVNEQNKWKVKHLHSTLLKRAE